MQDVGVYNSPTLLWRHHEWWGYKGHVPLTPFPHSPGKHQAAKRSKTPAKNQKVTTKMLLVNHTQSKNYEILDCTTIHC